MVSHVDMGHLATLHHQRAIKQLVFGLERLYRNGEIVLEPLPETDIDPGNPESKRPDLILQDNDASTVPVIIEVATNRGWRTDFRKLRELIDQTEFGIVEGFVLNFEQRVWHRYSKSGGEVQTSFSEVLEHDLGKMLE